MVTAKTPEKTQTPDRDYYRKLRRKADRYRADLEGKIWCDFSHTHFDWFGLGDLGWVHRRRHLNALLRALTRARKELEHARQPCQLFARVYPKDSANDALYLHTQNPNGTEFPCKFSGATPCTRLPSLLGGRIDPALYTVLRWGDGEDASYIILARDHP